jgi:hypothetical protein
LPGVRHRRAIRFRRSGAFRLRALIRGLSAGLQRMLPTRTVATTRSSYHTSPAFHRTAIVRGAGAVRALARDLPDLEVLEIAASHAGRPALARGRGPAAHARGIFFA